MAPLWVNSLPGAKAVMALVGLPSSTNPQYKESYNALCGTVSDVGWCQRGSGWHHGGHEGGGRMTPLEMVKLDHLRRVLKERRKATSPCEYAANELLSQDELMQYRKLMNKEVEVAVQKRLGGQK